MYNFFIMEYIVEKEFLSKLGRMNGKVREEIVKKFPEIYNDEAKFCYIGQIIYSKKKESFYTIVKVKNEIKFLNITNSSFWKNTIKLDYDKYPTYTPGSDDDKIITKGMFRDLLGEFSYRFEEFIPIRNNDMLRLRNSLMTDKNC